MLFSRGVFMGVKNYRACKKLRRIGVGKMSALTRDTNIPFMLKADAIPLMKNTQTKEEKERSRKAARAFANLLVKNEKK